MTKKKRFITFFLILLTTSVKGNARTEYAVQPVVDLRVDGTVWNLSGCEELGDETAYRVDDEGDLCRVWSPTQRFDFYQSGDTVRQWCAESRAYRAFYLPAMLRQLPEGENGSSTFTLNGRVHQSEFVTGCGSTTVDAVVKGRLVDADGDTVTNARLHHDRATMRWHLDCDSLVKFETIADSLVNATSIDTWYIMVPGETFPRAVKRVSHTVCLDGTYLGDSLSWIRRATPAENAERHIRLVKKLNNLHIPDANEVIDSTTEIRLVMPSGANEAITILPTSDMSCLIAICDILGRYYYYEDEYVTPSGISLSVADLPHGEYVLTVLQPSGWATIQEFIR